MKQLFLTSASDYVIEDLIKHLSKKPAELNLVFINTAAEVEEGDHWWVKVEREKLLEVGFNVDEFSITGMTKENILKKLKNKQVIYFCGGNTLYLLDQVIKTGCDEILRDKINNGIIYIGSSAGSMIVGKRIDLISTIDEKSKAPDLKSTGLGIVDLCVLPHWGSKEFKEEYLDGIKNMYAEGVKIVPITNKQYVFVEDNNKIELMEV